MDRSQWLLILVLGLVLGLLLLIPQPALSQDLNPEDVLNSIESGKKFLINAQQKDGSWSLDGNNFQIGVTSLALLALLNSGMTADDPAISNGLNFLRSGPATRGLAEPSMTYEISLMIMALAAAKDGKRDLTIIAQLADKLENGQLINPKNKNNFGSWTYKVNTPGNAFSGDRSNGQYAILGLRDAAHAGIEIKEQTWEWAREHWLSAQNNDGGWGYSGRSDKSTGSMTVAGIATLVITSSMLRDGDEFEADGVTPRCCPKKDKEDAIEQGIRWMENHFNVRSNPASGNWLLYYLYGLERAGRLSGRRFFGEHDWYREGVKFLIDHQIKRTGAWQGTGSVETHPVVGTSFALLFLSKGLAPVLINKLKFGPRNPNQANHTLSNNWNRHQYDIRNLTDHVSSLPKWPNLLTWQEIDIRKVVENGSVEDLMQAPILYLSGTDELQLTDAEIQMLKNYIAQGGFIFAVNNCNGIGFHTDIQELVKRIYPTGEARLKRLTAEHPVYRSEYLLDADTVELHGVDFGCRTAIMYSPDDLSCMWDKWARHHPAKRTNRMKLMITKAMRVGVNVVAYATGRELLDKLQISDMTSLEGEQDKIERGFLQIAKIRHTGGWDAAPQALKNLLLALNRTVGMAASTKVRNLPMIDPNLFKYPMVYMHGRNVFQMSDQEAKQLRTYLERGGVMFADACCGASQFDESFRRFLAKVFPNKKLTRIPVTHEMFSEKMGHNIRRVKRRSLDSAGANVELNPVVREVEPFLEGIEISGRYAIIYSKYDISCALERQASVACSGYLAEDALKIALNVVLYAMTQDVTYVKEQ